MPLPPGTRLGPYEVVAPIGAGGMGEVYKARDTKLNRDVALKVLPDLFAADPERLARFQREAQVLASLNHPNIAAIYGFEEADGVRALVLEFVEGPTLADRIAHGPIAIDDALPIARQIAEALEAAHEHGIIHRDLKPANIKIRPDGTVKVLDFGLAKLTDASGSATSVAQGFSPGEVVLSQSPTRTTPAATRMGVILGTAAYMSPEQARGKPVDKRADIWAFGCLVFEMLTGRRAFEGGDISEVLAAVIKSEPALDALPADTPPALRAILGRSLQKDPRRRLRDIGDVRLALEGAFDAPAAQQTGAAAQPALPPQPAGWRRVATRAAVLLLGGIIVGLMVWSLTRPPAPVVARFPILLGAGETFTFTGRRLVALSNDARTVVYQANEGLFLRPVDQLQARLIAGTEEGGGRNPFFSPDGQWIGFWAGGALKKVGIGGGAAITLGPAQNPWGVSWEANDTILFGQGSQGIWQVPGAGGTPEGLISVEEGEQAHGPQLLPGGEWVLFTLRPRGTSSWDDAHIVAQSLQTGERRILITGGREGRYVATGHLVYVLRGVLLGVPFDAAEVRVTGGAVSLIEGIGDAGSTTGTAQYSLAPSGSLLYVPSLSVTGESTQRTLVWMDRDGREEPLRTDPRPFASGRISPDGSRVAVMIVEDNPDIWIWDLTRKTLTQLTFDPAVDFDPLWTPDGSRIVFASDRQGGGLFWQAADGTGSAERLLEASGGATPYSWSLNGELVFMMFPKDRSNTDLHLMSVGGSRAPETLLATDFNEDAPAVSPDGRWLAYESDESGEFEIYVRPFPGVNGGKWKVSSGGGQEPAWSPDGRELFYVGPDSLMVVPVDQGLTLSAGTPRPLFPRGGYLPARGGVARRYDIGPDGKRFLFVKAGSQIGDAAPVPHLIFVENWFEELKQRVPTN